MKFKKPVSIIENNASAGNNENNASDSTAKSNNGQDINSNNIKNMLGQSSDVVFREIYINGNKDFKVTLVFVDGMVNSKTINDDILKPLLQECKISQANNSKDAIDLLEHGVIYTSTVKLENDINQLVDDILGGFSALIFDSEKKAVAFETKGFEKRSITEPENESVLRGPRDSFVETLRTNTATIRRKIKSANLVIEETIVGKQTKTTVAVVYMKNIIDQKIVQQLHEKIGKVDIESVLNVDFLSQYLVDNKYSPYPEIDYTERPDRLCYCMLEGRAGIIVDGIPMIMIAPATFDKGLKSPEDYGHNTFINSFKRLLRYILLGFTLYLPAFYIAITTFSQEMLPAKFAVSIAAAREGVPFPSYLEVFLMIIAFEVLQEAGLRLPKAIGQTVSIIGTLVVGEAAVAANIVSAPVIIIVAITGIASFTIPNQDLSDATRINKIFMIILSSIAGLYGIAIGSLLILHHLCTLESFGVPYMSPFVANEGKDMKDTLLRLPVSWFKQRPEYLNPINKRRQK